MSARTAFAAVGAAILLALAVPAAAEGVAEPDGYRGQPYRAPVPDTLTGATVVDAADAMARQADGVTVFVDTMPRDVRPPDLPEGTIWHDKPRETIPGAIWLANTGYEALPPADAATLEQGLAAATGGDMDRPVLFFCMTDCWMSWNAAKRAMTLGYTDVLWFPGGADGWAAAGGELVVVEPWETPE